MLQHGEEIETREVSSNSARSVLRITAASRQSDRTERDPRFVERNTPWVIPMVATVGLLAFAAKERPVRRLAVGFVGSEPQADAPSAAQSTM